MEKLQLKTDAHRQFNPVDRRPSPKAGILLMLWGLFMIVSVITALAASDSQGASPEKGNSPMQPAATVTVKDVPSLDGSQPGRVETFTFGLG